MMRLKTGRFGAKVINMILMTIIQWHFTDDFSYSKKICLWTKIIHSKYNYNEKKYMGKFNWTNKVNPTVMFFFLHIPVLEANVSLKHNVFKNCIYQLTFYHSFHKNIKQHYCFQR